jgi:hypothetical protein
MRGCTTSSLCTDSRNLDADYMAVLLELYSAQMHDGLWPWTLFGATINDFRNRQAR